MSHCFYRVPKDALNEETAGSFNASTRESWSTGNHRIVLSLIDPNPALEAVGGERIAGSWDELRSTLSRSAALLDRIFQRRITREVTVEGRTYRMRAAIPRAEVRQDDEVQVRRRGARLRVKWFDRQAGDKDEGDWLPPVKVLGDA